MIEGNREKEMKGKEIKSESCVPSYGINASASCFWYAAKLFMVVTVFEIHNEIPFSLCTV